MYFDLHGILLPCQNTQKVNKQKNCCKNSGFIIGDRTQHPNINCYFFSKNRNFFSKNPQLQIENSGFVKTCDELVHNW